MDKKRGYNIKYLLLFTSAAALLCALAAYISINDTYKHTRERAAFLAESRAGDTRPRALPRGWELRLVIAHGY